MFSFIKIATFAALAFGTIASAAPAPVPAPEAGALEVRSVGTLTDALTNGANILQAPCHTLSACSGPTCFWAPSLTCSVGNMPSGSTPAQMQVVVLEIKAALEQTISDFKSSSGSGSSSPWATLSLLSVIVKVRYLDFAQVYLKLMIICSS